ncbi:MAG TPA: hypothetical protein VFI78_03820 [Salinimicrobium sp.]|nr:hypothetical protein [Salinimicrobium sp.]
MNQKVQKETVNYAEKWHHVEYIKSWVDEIYANKDFHSFSLQTMELIRKFNQAYILFNESNSEKDFLDLVDISEKLENKLMLEGTL